MFTSEFIVKLSNSYDRNEKATEIIRNLKILGISNEEIVNDCFQIINNHNNLKKSVLDYMFSFVPEELANQLSIKRMYGGFAINVTKPTLNAELALQLKNDTIHLKFDNENKCLYHQSWKESNEISKLLDKYLENNSDFNCWIKA